MQSQRFAVHHHLVHRVCDVYDVPNLLWLVMFDLSDALSCGVTPEMYKRHTDVIKGIVVG